MRHLKRHANKDEEKEDPTGEPKVCHLCGAVVKGNLAKHVKTHE